MSCEGEVLPFSLESFLVAFVGPPLAPVRPRLRPERAAAGVERSSSLSSSVYLVLADDERFRRGSRALRMKKSPTGDLERSALETGWLGAGMEAAASGEEAGASLGSPTLPNSSEKSLSADKDKSRSGDC